MIILTGATGKLGQAIAKRLLEQLPPDKVGFSVRDLTKAGALQQSGARVRQADFQDGASLRAAFEGASQVLIISTNSSGDSAVTHHQNAIEAARAVGASRVLYTSHMGASPTSLFAPMVDHAATEEILKTCGLPFTSLRNGFYADSALMLLGRALETGEIVAPADGPVSWTAHDDLAEAAVIALTDATRLSGITPALTGSQALDLEALGSLSDRPCKRVEVSDVQHKESLVSYGLPPERAQMLLGLFAASRRGEFSAVDPTLERLLGRPPITMGEILTSKTTASSASRKRA
jgi:NAD(P)H dehydrogenase (quinone)